jgi:hypothetical protein
MDVHDRRQAGEVVTMTTTQDALLARIIDLLQRMQALQLEDRNRLTSLLTSYIDLLDRNVEDAAA